MGRSSREPWQPEQRRQATVHLSWKVVINDMDSAEFDVVTGDLRKERVSPQPKDGGSVSGNLTWNRVSPGWDITRKSPPCR